MGWNAARCSTLEILLVESEDYESILLLASIVSLFQKRAERGYPIISFQTFSRKEDILKWEEPFCTFLMQVCFYLFFYTDFRCC